VAVTSGAWYPSPVRWIARLCWGANASLPPLLLVAACSASGAAERTDGGSSEAADNGAMSVDDGASEEPDTDGGAGEGAGSDAAHYVLDAYVGGPLPSGDAAEFGPDGCALLNVPCLHDSTCCTLLCLQGVCVSGPHPGHARNR
jgi:hypothetical protein